jgi:DNA-binding response OmpR family regulator
MDKILIIEDEESILLALEDNLTMEGYEVSSARDGKGGLAAARERAHDLIILDIMLPRMNGFDVCRTLRSEGIKTPILMLTAKSQEVDKVLGLELGADDYVTKPFGSRELLARVKALLRRSKPQEEEDVATAAFGGVDVDFKQYEVKKGGRPVSLTALEFKLLRFLIRNLGKVLSRGAILDEVWGEDVYVQPRTVDKHIAELRRKLEDDPQNPKHIVGVRSVGYKFLA